MNKLTQILAGALLSISLNTMAGDCPALSGKYTIGKSETADFSSVTQAVNAAQCGGVTGPVTFMLESGTYNERVVMSAIPGASVYNTITIQSKSGQNTDVVISYGASDATLVMNGTSFVSFENISVEHDAAVYGNAMRVDGKAGNLHFKDVIFTGVEVARTGANSATVFFTPNAPKNNIAFEDCEINNGSTGIYKGGMDAASADSKTSIAGTLFYNQYETGLVLNNETAPVLTNNVVSSLSSYAGFKGFNLENISGCMIISNNIIAIASGSAGIAMNNCVASAKRMGEITNNSVTIGGKIAGCGIQIAGNTDNQILNFNRVKLTNGLNNTNQAYYQNTGTGNNINIMNNIFFDLKAHGYTIVGNTYKDMFNQLPGQSNAELATPANGIMVEKVTALK